MVTPFTRGGDFAPQDVAAVVRHYAASAPGLLVCGSTGEQHCLSVAERAELYRLCRAAAPAPEYPLYAGVAAFTTRDAVVLAKAAQAAGMT
eukprot:SAG22_NODE_19749_length_272_cov_0.583815_1_plen_90_part_11